MLLKRIYDHSSGAPVLSHVRILRAGKRQKFPQDLVMTGASEGWLSLAAGRIALKSDPPLAYRIVRGPGRYCCHCGAPLAGEMQAAAHLVAEHAGLASPDPANPSGYEHAHYFDCLLED